MSNKIQSVTQEYRGFKLIPLVIRYAAGVPSILSNPMNEEIAVGDTGTGDVSLTLASASLAPLMAWVTVRPTDPNTLGLFANIDGATTTTVVNIVVNSGADGATETDPVDLHVLLIKTVVN